MMRYNNDAEMQKSFKNIFFSKFVSVKQNVNSPLESWSSVREITIVISLRQDLKF